MQQDTRKVAGLARFARNAAIGALAISSVNAFAQGNPANEEGATADQQIIVTGSRIVRDGFESPSPVTVIGQQQVQARAQTNIAEALNELPSFRALVTPATQQAQGGNVGARILDLRGLGPARTLVLLDGKRYVPSTLQGTLDVNLMPTMLIQRTEVVTGGASAAYGSDAVAGVVNFIIDKNFKGLKANAQAGVSSRGDAQEYNLGLAYGTGFADNRGHLVASIEYNDNKGMGDCYTRIKWCPNEQLLSNTPAGSDGLPANVRVGPNGTATQAVGGLINAGPLRGLTFNQNGSTRPYGYGRFFGTNLSPLFTLGGENALANGFLLGITLSPPVERLTSFVHTDYEFSDAFKVNLDLSYGQVKGTVRGSAARITDAIIQRDNAYLPTATGALMDANGISSFSFGRFFSDRGGSINKSDNKTYRAVLSFEGKIGTNWGWDAYYQYGRNEFRQDYSGNAVISRLRNAVDAVNSGGTVKCRINADASTTNDDASCVALNPFGPGNVSDAAWNYVAPSGFQTANTTEHVIAANIHGDLFQLPGGPFSVAGGGEFRSDKLVGTADALSSTNQFWSFNGKAVNGKIDVTEGYVEAVAPIVKDIPGIKSLELNGAIRRTHYNRDNPTTGSSSLSVTTWKVGGVYEPIEQLRFRATKSRDIRAPNLNELFGPVTTGRVSIIDPSNAGLLVEAVAFSGANPALQAEKADTFTVGAVLKPDWFIPNFSVSVDYFDIKLQGAIATLGSQTIVNRCASGATEFCPYVTRNSSNIVTEVRDVLNNVNEQKVRGLDIEASYRTELAAGTFLGLRLLATHYMELSTKDSVGVTDRAGQTGYRGGATPGVPDWIVDGNIDLSFDQVKLGAHGHYIPKGKFDALLVGPEDPGYSITRPDSVNSNRIEGRFYLDLSASVKVNDNFEIYTVVNNVLDKDPPLAFSSQGGTNHIWFDTVGRYIKVGVRLAM